MVYNQTVSAGDIVVYTNGLIDILKQIEAGSGVSAVEPTQPFKAVRGLFVDCARKYFSVSWFENIIREMSWNLRSNPDFLCYQGPVPEVREVNMSS